MLKVVLQQVTVVLIHQEIELPIKGMEVPEEDLHHRQVVLV
jgi:hypothetical protein